MSCFAKIPAQVSRTVHCLTEVRDHTAQPSPDLVAEDAKATRPACPDRSLTDDTPSSSVPIKHRCLLDHIASLRHVDLQRRVIEVTDKASLKPRGNSLIDPSIQADEIAAGPQRKPVQVYSNPRRERTVLPSGTILANLNCHRSPVFIQHGLELSGVQRAKVRARVGHMALAS